MTGTAARPFGMRSVTVYAGSAIGNRPSFRRAAVELGRDLAIAGVDIVYGGGAVGLMGAVADAALAAGGRVIGVIPSSLVAAEVAHDRLTEIHVVETMHERKSMMADLGDCFVALPGGIGTIEEILEVWALLILGHHAKPVTLLNVDGYWDHLRILTRQMAGDGFLSADELATLIPVSGAEDLYDTYATWQPPQPRWPARDDATALATATAVSLATAADA